MLFIRSLCSTSKLFSHIYNSFYLNKTGCSNLSVKNYFKVLHRLIHSSSRISSIDVPPAKIGQAASLDEKREFLAVLPNVVQDLTQLGSNSEIDDAKKWFAKVLQYNLTGGKMNRGLAVGLSLKEILSPEEPSAELLNKAYIVGWCIELLQSHFLLADDIIDGSELRRGKECWHRKEGVGLMSINDSLMLNAGIYELLRKHFSKEESYSDILDLFHDVTMKTTIGQSLDLHSCPVGQQPDLSKFTMQRYESIIKYKTAYYSFYLPVAVAMHMAGIRNTDYTRVADITDRELHRQAKTIQLEMGSFFQVQDDFLDCYGDSAITGKVGTDIAEGKCTWLAVVALQRASKGQRALMEEHYGRNEEDSIGKIKHLYNELNLPATYKAYEDSTQSLIRIHIQQISRGLNHNIFFKFLEKIHKRIR